MKRAFILGLILAAAAQISYAQDYHRGELYVGYSHNRVDTGFATGDLGTVDGVDLNDFVDTFDRRTGFNGFEVSATGNFSRYVGAKFDFTGHYHSDDVGFGVFPAKVNESIYNVLGGVQVKDNTEGATLKPFGHALFGAAVGRAKFDFGGQLPGFDTNAGYETGFAAAVGGGLDVRLSDSIDVRAIQVDWNPTRLFDNTQHNVRIGVGLVFH